MSDLHAQIQAISHVRESKQDVIEYFKEQYPGSKMDSKGRKIEKWRGEAANALSEVTGLSHDSALRRFQGTRAESSKVTNKTKAEFKAIGEKLPIKPPPGGYHIFGTVYMKFSSGDCEEREVDEYITGEEADELANMSNGHTGQAVVNHYMEDALWSEPSARIGGCQEPELTVDAIEEE